jgi:type III restriction enzyme
VETKSSLFAEYLRGKEAAKIDCGKVHFQALAAGDNPAKLVTARNLGDLFSGE